MNNDLIRREALKKEFDEYGEKAKFTQGACQQLIDNAPTVEPPEWQFEFVKMLYEKARKQGEWIYNKYTDNIICSRCRKSRRDARTEHVYFCNHCGARMLKASEVRNETDN